MISGTHILLTASSSAEELLLSPEKFRAFVLEAISNYGLVQVGHVFHSFDTGGFTGVVCLTESHLALHTWPELGQYTFDIYLCDFSRNNYDTTIALSNQIKSYFNSYNIKEEIIKR